MIEVERSKIELNECKIIPLLYELYCRNVFFRFSHLIMYEDI